MYVNLSDLANMAAEQQRDQGTDSDQTPTEKSPPSTMSPQVCIVSLPLPLYEGIFLLLANLFIPKTLGYLLFFIHFEPIPPGLSKFRNGCISQSQYL